MRRPNFAPFLLAAILLLFVVGCALVGGLFSPPLESDGALVEVIVADADVPVDLAFAPDGRAFYTEKNTGLVRVIRDGELLDEAFAAMSVDRFGERGLLGIALHPQFAVNHYLYVYYSKSTGDGVSNAVGGILEHRIVRFVADADVAAQAEELIATLPGEGGGVHNGGILRFGPDGKLYVAIGDLTSPDSAQDMDALSGKMLRFNDDGTIPDDNPFPGCPIYAVGLRNTFGHGFDDQGRLFGWENGGGNNDEINRIDAGANLGWPAVHGMADDAFANPLGEIHFANATAAYLDPLLDKNDGSVGAAGLAINPGDVYGAHLRGQIFYGELRNRRVMRIRLDGDATQVVERAVFASDLDAGVHSLSFAPDGFLWATTASSIIRFHPAPDTGG